MKSKLTLTIEQSLIEKAKQITREEGKSLSSSVEHHFKNLIKKRNKRSPQESVVDRLIGAVEVEEGFDYKEILQSEREKKHLD